MLDEWQAAYRVLRNGHCEAHGLPSIHTCRGLRPRKEFNMAQYSPKASRKVEKVMHEFKEGTLKSGTSGKPVKSRKQAVAIGLSEARHEGAKVPPASGHARKSSKSHAAHR
jgi:hypothetical protein